MWPPRVAVAAAVALAAGLVASCGGGTEFVEPFVPQQVILLGDETNALTLDGRNYSVNGLNASGVIDCRLLPIWTQSVVGAWGYVLDRCNPGGATPVRGVTRAAFNAKATDLGAQIDAQLATAAPTSKDLFTVLVGMHDIIGLYEQYPARSEADLTAELGVLGNLVAQQINRLVALGGRVIVSTVPDLGLTPYALQQEAQYPGRAALLTRLTAAFNARVRVDIVQDGRYIGLILADDLILQMVKYPQNFGLTNTTSPACTVAVPDCTTGTLVASDAYARHLWADDRRIGPVAHSQLYNLALTRAQRNPF